MSLIVINKWWRCKRCTPWINNCDWRRSTKGSNVTNGNQQILWIIDSIEHLLFQSGLSHVLSLFSNVRKTSYTPSSHVMLVQRHGWDLNNMWISLKSDISFSKLDFFVLFFIWISPNFFFSDIQEFNKIYLMLILNGKAGINLSLALPHWSVILIV